MTNIRFTQIILFFTPPLLEAKAANTSRRGLSLRAVGGAEADGRSDQEKPKKKRNIEDARLSRDYFVTVLHRQEQSKWAATKSVIHCSSSHLLKPIFRCPHIFRHITTLITNSTRLKNALEIFPPFQSLRRRFGRHPPPHHPRKKGASAECERGGE